MKTVELIKEQIKRPNNCSTLFFSALSLRRPLDIKSRFDAPTFLQKSGSGIEETAGENDDGRGSVTGFYVLRFGELDQHLGGRVNHLFEMKIFDENGIESFERSR